MFNEEISEFQAGIRRVRRVDEQNVTTWTRNFSGCCCMEAEAGTNGYQGGDAGHGSRVFLRLADLRGSDFCYEYDGEELNASPDEIVIALAGDAELSAIKDVLRWWLFILEAQSE